MTARRFVLLDRDGTLIVEREYLAHPEGVTLIPGGAEGLRRLACAGFGLAVVTNQSGIARGYFDEERLKLIHERMVELLAEEGVRLDGIYYCPHAPDDDCACRKPRTGLVDQAVMTHGFDPGRSFVIGDNVGDIQLGRNVGATTILVESGYGKEVASRGLVSADHVVADLSAAAALILRLKDVHQSDD